MFRSIVKFLFNNMRLSYINIRFSIELTLMVTLLEIIINTDDTGDHIIFM